MMARWKVCLEVVWPSHWWKNLAANFHGWWLSHDIRKYYLFFGLKLLNSRYTVRVYVSYKKFCVLHTKYFPSPPKIPVWNPDKGILLIWYLSNHSGEFFFWGEPCHHTYVAISTVSRQKLTRNAMSVRHVRSLAHIVTFKTKSRYIGAVAGSRSLSLLSYYKFT